MPAWLRDKRLEIEATLQRLRARAARIEAHRANERQIDAGDLIDRAQLHDNDEVVEALGSRAEGDVPALEAALARIDDGTYGYCVACDTPIARQRLDLLPATRHCARCASAETARHAR